MAERMSFGSLPTGGGAAGGSGAFRILLLGDFSGRGARGLRQPLAGRKMHFVDVDNWEDVLASLDAGVDVAVGGAGSFPVRPRSIDDLHPDELYDNLDIFQALRSLRQRLTNASTYEAAAAEVRSWASAPPEEPADEDTPAEPGGTDPPADGGSETDDDTLGRLLGERPAGVEPATAASGGGSRLDAMIRQIVAPHVVPDRDKEQSALVARVDDAIAELMRSLLHDPGFQATEAAWRSLHFLVTHLETDEELKLHLLDVSRDELDDDLLAAEDLQSTELFKRLFARSAGSQGGEPWALVAGAYTFEKTPRDAGVLGRIAKIAKASGAAFLAGASARIAGCESLAATPDPDDWAADADADAEAAWSELRKLPEAGHVALGLPRMLLRLPYGRNTDPVDRFTFEELTPDSGHEAYLWGSPAFALAQVLGAGFTEAGWAMAAELYRDIEDVPMHVWTDDAGDRRVTPPAEAYLTDRAGQALQEMGLTALLSIQGRDALRVRGVACLHDPVTALAGPWT